jgi:hypothetical protein
MGTRGLGFLPSPISPTLFYYYSLLLSTLTLYSHSYSLSLSTVSPLLSPPLSSSGLVNPFTERSEARSGD